MFLRYDAKIQINTYDKELMHKGKPTTVSLTKPAKKTKKESKR